MNRPIFRSLIVTLASAGFLLADFSYEQTSRITGGAMASMMKLAGAFSKTAREPMKSTVSVKGDRMVHLTNQHASVIDLGKETITDIDFQKKTYSVMTFAEMKQMLEELSKNTKKDPNAPEMELKVSVQETGQTKDVAGMNAKEVILKIIMETADKKSGQKGGMTVTSNMWLTAAVAGYDEVASFQKRMAEKLAWTPGGGMMQMGGSEIGKGMSQLAKEASKLKGIPVLQYVRMGAEGMPQPEGGQAQQQPQQEQQQQQQPQQQETQVEKPSLGGALGGALGGRLGGFGRKRKTTPPPEQQQQPQQQQQQSQAQGAPAGTPGSLMEMTTEMSGFSSAAVDSSRFEVPAGFKQVKAEKRTR